MAFRSTPPARTCGATSPYTISLRPRIGLSAEQCQTARFIRRQHPDATAAEIAAQLGATEADVRQALATLRTRNPRPTRRTANVTLEAAEFLAREAGSGEAVWQVTDRLLGELAQLRAIVAGWSAEAGRKASHAERHVGSA